MLVAAVTTTIDVLGPALRQPGVSQVRAGRVRDLIASTVAAVRPEADVAELGIGAGGAAACVPHGPARVDVRTAKVAVGWPDAGVEARAIPES